MKKVRTAISTYLALNIEDLGSGTATFLKSRFTHANPEHAKIRRLGYWTGNIPKTIQSWSSEDGWLLLPRGARQDVEEVLAARGMKMDPVWDRTVILESIGTRLRKKLYPFQKKAVAALVNAGGGVLRGPCGSGKTIILLATIATIGQPTLVVVHNGALMKQWCEMVGDWLGMAPGTIGGGKADNVRPVTIGMQQTLCKREGAPWINSFGVVAVDECHVVGAKTFNFVASMFPARWKAGCSADERRKDGKEFLVYETLGPIVHKIKKDRLIDIGRLLPIRMEVVQTDYVDEEYATDRADKLNPNWGRMLNALVCDDKRNDLIARKVMSILKDRNARILMLTERISTVRWWVKWLRGCGVLTGAMIGGPENREELDRTIFGLRSGEVRVGVGTKVADEGLDIPPLTHVVLTCPVHSHPKRLTQMVGRAARKWKGKTEGVAVYFHDQKMWPTPDENGSTSPAAKKKFLAGLGRVCASLEVVEL